MKMVKASALLGATVVVVVSLGASCALDTKGLFNEVGGGDAGDICIEFCESGPDAPADAGIGGETGEPVDASIYDSCDCGVGVGGAGGEAGQGGTAGSGGNAGAGGNAGQGGTAGAGGEAGQGGSAGQGGNAGAGGTAGSGGTAGAGGQGGSLPTCAEAGDPGTIDEITASGAIDTSLLLHFNDGSEQHSNATPTQVTFTGEAMPGQMVFVGKEGGSFSLFRSGTPVAKPRYSFTGLPASCAGQDLTSEACAHDVAQSFRCQFAPYNETVGCPSPPITFTYEGNDATWQDFTSGWKLKLVDLTCP